jgi:hypothetical protein
LIVQDVEELPEDVDAHGRIGAHAAIVPVIAPTIVTGTPTAIGTLFDFGLYWRSVSRLLKVLAYFPPIGFWSCWLPFE